MTIPPSMTMTLNKILYVRYLTLCLVQGEIFQMVIAAVECWTFTFQKAKSERVYS